jgi:ParB-like partition proteins
MSKKSSKNKRSSLGKGIGALLSTIGNEPTDQPTSPDNLEKGKLEKEAIGSIIEIPLEKVEVNPHQPRKTFEPGALAELSDSIATHGLIQPITVRRMGDGTFQLISGERRLRASKLADLVTIPAYIREADDKEMQEMALIENLQREDLSPMEVATTYKLLIDKYELTQEELGTRVNKSRVSITQILSLLSLPPTIIEALNNKMVSRGHAIILAREEDPALQLMLLNRVVNEKLSVRALEQAVANMKNPPANNSGLSSSSTKELPIEFRDVENNLKDFFETKVQLKAKSNGKGQIVIPFGSVKDLNRLLEKLDL